MFSARSDASARRDRTSRGDHGGQHHHEDRIEGAEKNDRAGAPMKAVIPGKHVYLPTRTACSSSCCAVSIFSSRSSGKDWK